VRLLGHFLGQFVQLSLNVIALSMQLPTIVGIDLSQFLLRLEDAGFGRNADRRRNNVKREIRSKAGFSELQSFVLGGFSRQWATNFCSSPMH
jgi:hypothetical protein